MTFYQLGFFIMTGAAISMAFLIRALARRNRRAYALLRQYREYYSEPRGYAVILQYGVPTASLIVVCCYYKGRRFDIKHFHCDQSDPDDYIYKYKLAEELRDKYNEEP